jgi:hypothetical protein
VSLDVNGESPIQGHTLIIRRTTARFLGININAVNEIVGCDLTILKPIINNNEIDTIIFDGFSMVCNSAFKDCELFQAEPASYKIKHIEFKQAKPLSLDPNAFQNCNILEDIKVSGDSSVVNYISNYAFAGCTSLTGFIDNSVTIKAIGSYAFMGCTHLSYAGIRTNVSFSDTSIQ